ncbi:hypothetical protein KKB99_01375, partial [bacterium]|nr:hypothetical protein [bacterium]MBU1024636.1 hypothetical protein [bacterium]
MFFISKKHLLLTVFIGFFVYAGCSSQNRQTNQINQITTPDFASLSTGSSQTYGHSIHSIYKIYVDTLSQSVEMTPLRQSDLDLHVNLNPYLLSAPCRDCLRLDSVGFDSDNQLLLDFGLTHAFQDPAIRPDLNGFDLRGIIALPGTTTFPLTPHTKAVFDPETHLMLRDARPISLNPGAVINADGYTPLWDIFADMPEFAENIPGTLNPFIDYFREDNPDPLVEGNLIPWRTFAVGAGWDFKRYILDLAKLDPVFEFYFIADVTYGQSATWKTRQNPFYRNPQFNMKEAYEVVVDVNSEMVTGEILSTCDLTITVKDWQAGSPLVIDPLNPGQYEIDAKSDVSQITIDAPDFQFG